MANIKKMDIIQHTNQNPHKSPCVPTLPPLSPSRPLWLPPYNAAPPPEARTPEPSWLLLSRKKNIITQIIPEGEKIERYENASLELGNLAVITRLLDCYWFFGSKLWWGNLFNGNINSELDHWSLVIDRAKSGYFCLIWIRGHWRATWIILEKYFHFSNLAFLTFTAVGKWRSFCCPVKENRFFLFFILLISEVIRMVGETGWTYSFNITAMVRNNIRFTDQKI